RIRTPTCDGISITDEPETKRIVGAETQTDLHFFDGARRISTQKIGSPQKPARPGIVRIKFECLRKKPDRFIAAAGIDRSPAKEPMCGNGKWIELERACAKLLRFVVASHACQVMGVESITLRRLRIETD